jgi:hypothetical protein
MPYLSCPADTRNLSGIERIKAAITGDIFPVRQGIWTHTHAISSVKGGLKWREPAHKYYLANF